MKLLSYILLFFSFLTYVQSQEDFELEIEPLTIVDVPGIHSFSVGQDSLGRWLIFGGRIDGLHQRQPFAAFLATSNNKNVFVIDPKTEQVWSSALNVLAAPLYEQLQATNQEYFQRDNQLYIIGGYAYSPTVGDHITFPYLTAIDVNGLSNAIVNGNSIVSYFRQISDTKMAVTGGQLGYLDSIFYLAGGQYFEGRYNPMGPTMGPGFIQEYTEAIRKFKIIDDGLNLSIAAYSEIIDSENLHRRDYNMAPQVFPNGDLGFTMFSGVFQKTVDLPFLNSVDIRTDGYAVNNNFSQYLSQYHSAHLAIQDADANVMHTIFFGGMSQYSLNENGVLIEDENVPFVKTISKVSRFSDGTMQEAKLDLEMPSLVGSGAEFIPIAEAPFSNTGILDLNELSQQKTLIGYIYGGIESSQENIFFINNGTQSFASNVIFKVFLNKETNSVKDIQVVSEDVFKIKVYPNPGNQELVLEYFNPSTAKLNIALSDMKGRELLNIFQGIVSRGKQKRIVKLPELANGTYLISIENEKNRNTKMIIIQ